MKKYYISESAAIKKLQELTKKNITSSDMLEYSNIGVVPAYMKYKSNFNTAHPRGNFYFVIDQEVDKIGLENLTTRHGSPGNTEWSIIPYPLPKNGKLKVIEGITLENMKTQELVDVFWYVFAVCEDGTLEAISEENIERVYAPQEVQQAAKNLTNYINAKSYKPMKHSCAETWDSPDLEITPQAWFASPFDNENYAQEFNTRARKGAQSLAKDQSDEDLPCMGLVIAGMLELIKKLNGPSYNKAKINLELRKILPQDIYRGMGETRINHAFSAATRAKKAAELKHEIDLQLQ